MSSTSTSPLKLTQTTIEDPIDWDHHIAQCKKRGLTCKAYCRQQNIHYESFLYRYKSVYPAKPKSKLIPITVKPTTSLEHNKALCHIELRKGHRLVVHEAGILNVILNKLL